MRNCVFFILKSEMRDISLRMRNKLYFPKSMSYQLNKIKHEKSTIKKNAQVSFNLALFLSIFQLKWLQVSDVWLLLYISTEKRGEMFLFLLFSFKFLLLFRLFVRWKTFSLSIGDWWKSNKKPLKFLCDLFFSLHFILINL